MSSLAHSLRAPARIATPFSRGPVRKKTHIDLAGSDMGIDGSRTAACPQTLAGQGSQRSANGRAFRVVSYFRKRLSQLVG
jgi:hypothetical protein